MSSHTIILWQETKDQNTRSYADYESIGAATEAIIKMYENKLAELNPHVPHITYSLADLYAFIDHLTDLCALVFDPALSGYSPKDKEWLKQKCLNKLKKQQNQK